MSNIFGRLFGDRHLGGAGTPSAVTLNPFVTHWLDTTPVESNDKPCTVQSLEVSAAVRGIYAEVTQTIVIANPNARPISTTLTVPLPDRAVVCGYALEIDGQMVEGVVVPKEKARVVFEAEQRRHADPGLVEAVRGNVYSTRVYPVPPCGARSVRLSYVTPLQLGADGSATLVLPMPEDHLDERVMHIAVEMLDAPEPVISGLAGTLVSHADHQWSLETTERDLTPTGPVSVAMPDLPSSFALLECDDEGATWFCATCEGTNASAAESPELRALTVLWDASGSRGAQDHKSEIELLRAYASAPTVAEICLVVFADRVREVLSVASANELVRHIQKLSYDGGTSFEALADCSELPATALQGISAGSACVLFTDGLDTLGRGGFSLPEGMSVLTVVSGTSRDAEAMRQGCRGPVLDLAQAPKDAAGFMRALLGVGRLSMEDVVGSGVADVCDVSAPDGSRLAVIGRLTAEKTQLRVGANGQALTLDASAAHQGRVLSRAWAARRITLLSPRADENADELLSLGRRFGMASPATSLLVLETLDQWLRYEIEPPRSLEEMHSAWERSMEGRMRLESEESRKMMHRSHLASSWRGIMDWWERDYSAPAQRRSMGRVCPTCGSEYRPGARFCAFCGAPIDAPRTQHTLITDVGAGFPFDAPEPRMRRASEPSFMEMDAMALSAPSDSLLLDDMFDEGFADYAVDNAPAPMAASAPSMSFTSAMAAPSMAAPSMPAPSMAFSMSDTAGFAMPSGPAERSSSRPTDPSMSVSVKGWMPNAPYLKALDKAYDADDPQAARSAYLGQRKQYRTSPSFFLDCAGWFLAHDDREFGTSVLTNLAELRIEDAGLLRVMAWRLREAGMLELSLVTLRRVRGLRSEDSQSYRDLALVLAELAREAMAEGDEDFARAYAEEAGELYRKVALTAWDRRPIAIALFAVEEYNVLRAWADAQSWKQAPELPTLGEDLEGVPDCDLRITLAWDADETDVDIHVTEPSGEEAYYGHRNTSSGGRVSEDITDGYGPELYEIHHAQDGTYNIRAHYYASHQQTVFGPATCTLTVYSDWGRPNQTQVITTRRLEQSREMTQVGTASYGTAKAEEHAEGASATAAPVEQDPSRIEAGMTKARVIELMGPADNEDTGELDIDLHWTLPNGHKLVILFIDGKVHRALEQMPWGETSIVVS